MPHFYLEKKGFFHLRACCKLNLPPHNESFLPVLVGLIHPPFFRCLRPPSLGLASASGILLKLMIVLSGLTIWLLQPSIDRQRCIESFGNYLGSPAWVNSTMCSGVGSRFIEGLVGNSPLLKAFLCESCTVKKERQEWLPSTLCVRFVVFQAQRFCTRGLN